jgi:hypothetical protein
MQVATPNFLLGTALADPASRPALAVRPAAMYAYVWAVAAVPASSF